MKSFSGEKDRDFEVMGEAFRWVYPYWEDIADQFDRDDESDEEKEATETNGNVSVTVRSTLSDFIHRIELFIDPDFNDGVNRWRKLTKRRKDPIPHTQYSAIYQYLLEVTSRHPTDPSSPSEDGQLPIEPTSVAGSS